jgi:hypothetical protein
MALRSTSEAAILISSCSQDIHSSEMQIISKCKAQEIQNVKRVFKVHQILNEIILKHILYDSH